MNPLLLRTRPREPGPEPVAGVLIGADSTPALLESLDRLGLVDAALYPIAAETHRRLIGLFVPLPTSTEIALPPTVALYQRLGRSLYLPIDAECVPPISAGEADQLCAGAVHVLHPTLGIRRFDANEAVRADAMLTSPVLAPARWDQAFPGPAPLPPLSSVVQELPDADEVDGTEAGDGIGEDPPPKKIAKRLRRAGRKDSSRNKTHRSPKPTRRPRPPSRNPLTRGLAHLALGITKLIPERGTILTMWDHLESWALDTLGNVPGTDSRESSWMSRLLGAAPRERRSPTQDGDDALAWLIKKLDRDPDAGLRHAIPFGDSHGEPPESWSTGPFILPHNVVDYRYRPLRSRSAGGFSVSHESFTQLHELYHELAQRELSLGRARRAAFIYSNLLNDHRGAANALKSAGFYREAAVLFRERCKDLASAAHCLEANRDDLEAAEMFEEIDDFRSAGRVRQRMGDHEAAAALYARQVQHHIDQQGFLAAAEVAAEDLYQPEWAMTLLMHGFEKGHEAAECLNQWFDRAAKADEIDRALAFVESHRGATPSSPDPQRWLALATALATQAQRSPSGELRESALDACRVLAGLALTPPRSQDAQQILEALREAGGTDKPLRRDIVLFQKNERLGATSIARMPDQIPLLGSPISATASEDGLLVLTRPGPQTVRLLEWSPKTGSFRQLANWTNVQFDHGWIVCHGRTRDGVLIIPEIGSDRLQPRKAYQDVDGHQPLVGTWTGVPDQVSCCTKDVADTLCVCADPDGGTSLVVLDQNGKETHRSAVDARVGFQPTKCTTVYNHLLLETAPGKLDLIKHLTGEVERTFEISGPVTSASPLGGFRGLVTTADQAYLVSSSDVHVVSVSPIMIATGFNNHFAVVWNAYDQSIYRLDSRNFELQRTISQPPWTRCVYVWPSPQNDQAILVLTRSGRFLLKPIQLKG